MAPNNKNSNNSQFNDDDWITDWIAPDRRA